MNKYTIYERFISVHYEKIWEGKTVRGINLGYEKQCPEMEPFHPPKQ